MEDCKPSSLSLPHIGGVVDSTKLTDSISQSESLPDSECLSCASSGVYVKAEPVFDSPDYAGVEPKARLNRSDESDTEEGRVCETAYGMTKEEKDMLAISYMKGEDVEEGMKRLNVKMERDDGVKYGEGLGREQEKARDEQQRNGVTHQTCPTHECQRNGGKSEYGQQEGAELSTLATACPLKQARVLIPRLKIEDISGSVSLKGSSSPKQKGKVMTRKRKMIGQKESPQKQPKQEGQVMTRKRKMIGQLESPQKQLPASSGNGTNEASDNPPPVISPRNENTGQSVRTRLHVFGCAKCPFVHTEEPTLRLHIMKVHPEDVRRAQRDPGV